MINATALPRICKQERLVSVVFTCHCNASIIACSNRELKKQRRWWQQKRHKSRLAKQQLCTWITLFCTFLCCHKITTTQNCLILRFVENMNARQWFSNILFLKLDTIQSLTIQLQENSLTLIIWQWWLGIRAMNFETVWIHFLWNVFATVVVVAPQEQIKNRISWYMTKPNFTYMYINFLKKCGLG